VERFDRSRPDRLEFVRLFFERSERKLDRDEFTRWIAALCAKQFPHDTVESFSSHQDLEHSLSGNYPRGVVRAGSARWAVVAACENESAAHAGRLLTFALLWLDRLRESQGRSPVAGLRLIVPNEILGQVVHLLAAINPTISVGIYEYNRSRETLEKINPSALANLSSWLVPQTRRCLDRYAQRPAGDFGI